jgi:hypothetical protein
MGFTTHGLQFRIGLFGPRYLSHFANGLLRSISFASHIRLLAHALSLSLSAMSEFLAHVLSLLMCWVLHLVALIYKAISGNKLKPIVLLCQTGQWIIKHLRPRYFMQAKWIQLNKISSQGSPLLTNKSQVNGLPTL